VGFNYERLLLRNTREAAFFRLLKNAKWRLLRKGRKKSCETQTSEKGGKQPGRMDVITQH